MTSKHSCTDLIYKGWYVQLLLYSTIKQWYFLLKCTHLHFICIFMYFTEFNPSYPMTPGEQNQVVTPMLQISNNLTSDEVSPEEDLDPLLLVEDSLIPPSPSSLSLLIWMRNCSRSSSLPKSHPNTQPVFLQFCCTSFVFNIYDADGLCRATHSIPCIYV